MSDRIMVMRDGRIEQLDIPDAIVDAPANQYVKEFVGDNLAMKLEALSRYGRA
jgi:ABC-type Fe3+/spermidine/putrescine transport system ATPase subunit